MAELLNAIIHIGWLAVVFVIFAESGLMIGFFLPGDSLLFTAGFLVQQQIFHINIHVFVLLLFIASICGNSLGYFFGRKIGRKLFLRKNSRLFRQKNLHRAEAFYEKHGPKTIILAMFVPIVRTFTPIVAGISNMSYKRFLMFNVIGAALWTGTMTYLGYYAGDTLQKGGINIEGAALIVVFVSILPGLYHLLKDKGQRKAFWNGTKRELALLFTKKK